MEVFIKILHFLIPQIFFLTKPYQRHTFELVLSCILITSHRFFMQHLLIRKFNMGRATPSFSPWINVWSYLKLATVFNKSKLFILTWIFENMYICVNFCFNFMTGLVSIWLKSDIYLRYRIEDLITPHYWSCSVLIILTNELLLLCDWK